MRTSCGSAGTRSTQLVVTHDRHQPRRRIAPAAATGRRTPRRGPAAPRRRSTASAGTITSAAAADRRAGSQGSAGSRRPNRAATRLTGPVLAPAQRQGQCRRVVTRDRQQHPHARAQQRIEHVGRARLRTDRHVGADRLTGADQRRGCARVSASASAAWTLGDAFAGLRASPRATRSSYSVTLPR